MSRFESSVSMPPRSLIISRKAFMCILQARISCDICYYGTVKSFPSDFQLTREQEKSTYRVGRQGSYSTNRIVQSAR